MTHRPPKNYVGFSPLLISTILLISGCNSDNQKYSAKTEDECPINSIDDSFEFKKCFKEKFSIGSEFSLADSFLLKHKFEKYPDDNNIYEYIWENCNFCTKNVRIRIMKVNGKISCIHILGESDGKNNCRG